MGTCTPARRPGREGQGGAWVPGETLHLLSAALRTAFRLHCTGEALQGQGPWQLVHAVQRRLAELCPGGEPLLSDERLAGYLEADPGLAEVA